MFEGNPWKNPFFNENYDKVCIIYLIFKKSNIGIKSLLYKELHIKFNRHRSSLL